MSRAALLIAFFYLTTSLCGCGSSSGENQTFTVRIQADGFVPRSLNIKPGDTVVWVNGDTEPHRVVSGVLDQTVSPIILEPIAIKPDNTFVPDSVEANFGDAVRWRNDQVAHFVLDIVDNVGNVVASLDLEPGQIVPSPPTQLFPSAGRYTYQQRNLPQFFGTLTLFGVPDPDGNFDSGVLPTGGDFRRTFNSVGAFPFFDLDTSDPNKSFRTGQITIQ